MLDQNQLPPLSDVMRRRTAAILPDFVSYVNTFALMLFTSGIAPLGYHTLTV